MRRLSFFLIFTRFEKVFIRKGGAANSLLGDNWPRPLKPHTKRSLAANRGGRHAPVQKTGDVDKMPPNVADGTTIQTDSMKPIGISPARRAFLRDALKMAPAAVAVGTGVAGSAIVKVASAADAEPFKPKYFTATEWTTLNALVDRLIPGDETGPGALQAGVAEFIDLQMNQPYGFGALWYMHPPFAQNASPLMGYQLEFSPRTLYRSALAGLEKSIHDAHGKSFSELDEATRDAVIGELEHGKLAIGDVPPADFFAQLLQNTREGYFCDPKHGGNKNMDAWRMINFPGARADYMDMVEQYGKRYPLPPVSIG